jgi:hypothetical protein
MVIKLHNIHQSLLLIFHVDLEHQVGAIGFRDVENEVLSLLIEELA